MNHPGQGASRRISQPWHRVAVMAAAAVVLAGCTFTGNGLNTAGLDHIVMGRTTLEQAAQDLGAQPTDIWRQGDSVLARWAYKGTVATDAVYLRQELWLRFGPDGTFQRVENRINVPALRHPKTAAEADREAARHPVPDQAADGTITIPGNGPDAPGLTGDAAAVPPSSSVDSAAPATAAADSGAQPLLPAGSQVIPGVTYPLPSR